MYNQLLLSLAITTIPILAFVFVGLLLLHKLFIKIRSNFDVTVNCWFCSQNTRVPYFDSNCWTCPNCEQYNGFTKDGDYNREIFHHRDVCGSFNTVTGNNTSERDTSSYALCAAKNGFCHDCNEAQRLKVEKLAQFEPKNEYHFDKELKVYKEKLEEQYRLCETCDRHLRKVLHEKKKMVLGSKFLDFIIRGAESMKQPHFNQIRLQQRQHWKRRLALHISILTTVNLFCVCCMLPPLTLEHLTSLLGQRFGQQLFIAISHVLALAHVLNTYLSAILTNHLVEKCKLFARTICMMLLYSLGLKVPQITRINFSSIYVLAYPFVILGMSFGYNIVDGFKLTRFTFLLALWSAFAGGLVEQFYLKSSALMLIASALTFALSITNEVDLSPKLHDTSMGSFHKIYSEDYLSDEDTISVLSQQCNCSDTSSVRSTLLGGKSSPLQKSRLNRSPVTGLTLFSHNKSKPQLSPNYSHQSGYFSIPCNAGSIQPHHADPSVGDFNNAFSVASLSSPTPFFGATCEINNQQRPLFTNFVSSVNNIRNSMNGSFSDAFCSGETNLHDMQKQSKDIFAHSRHGGSINRRSFLANSTLHSPFSLSSNVVYHQRRPTSTNMLTPSRFSTTSLPSNALGPTSFSVESFNHINKNFPTARQTMTTIGENLSRASSQSSGFESQNDRLNLTRENSFNTEGNDLAPQTKILDSTRIFQPITTNNRSTFSPRPSLLSNPQLVTPLTVNCGEPTPMGSYSPSDFWSTSNPRKNIGGRDIFNLRKINEELPLPTNKYKRGDLLKKWKERQMNS